MASWNTKLPPHRTRAVPPRQAEPIGLNEDGVPKKLVTWLWYWLPPLILMAMIFYVSSQSSLPQAQGEWVDALIKKISHIAEYTLLFLLLVRAWRWTLDMRGAGRTRPAENAGWSTYSVERALWAALLTTAVYGISDEVHQGFVPRRHSNWYDVVIDVAVPLLLCLLWYGRRGLLRPRDPDLAE
jgi:VanZ family protein